MPRQARTETKSARAEREPSVPQEEIAKVAYELFEQRGRTPGRELDDWLEAERVVRQRLRKRWGTA